MYNKILIECKRQRFVDGNIVRPNEKKKKLGTATN